MGSLLTAIRRLPYPAESDAPDVAADLAALATKLDTYGLPAVTTLPVGPVDGQECRLVVDSVNGVVWTFRYRAAATGTYKWEFVGGSPLFNEVTTGVQQNSATYADLSGSVGPSITLPTLPSGGDFMVELGAQIKPWGGGVGSASAWMSYTIGGTAASDTDALFYQNSNSSAQAPAVASNTSRARRKTGLTSATVLVAKYRTDNANNPSYSNRWMRVTPVRVG